MDPLYSGLDVLEHHGQRRGLLADESAPLRVKGGLGTILVQAKRHRIEDAHILRCSSELSVTHRTHAEASTALCPLRRRKASSGAVTSLCAACTGGTRPPRTAPRRRGTLRPLASPGAAGRRRRPNPSSPPSDFWSRGSTRWSYTPGGPQPSRDCHRRPTGPGARSPSMLLLFPAALGHAVRPSASRAVSFPWLTSP